MTGKIDNQETKKSIFFRNILKGIENKLITLSSDESKITYHCSRNYTTIFKNPEEKVRASYFVELVINYEYPAKRIDFEVIIPRRTPEDRADIVIFEDDKLKKPYLVVECKKDGISDSEFKQAIEQAFGNANSLRSKFASVVAGITKTAFDVAGFEPSEREKNVISDIPKRYGKTPKYRFIKGVDKKDLKVISRDELISALEKCHDTVWQGGKLAPTTAFDEVSKLLFCKLRDEKITKKGETYKFQIGTYETSKEVYNRINSIYLTAKQEDSEVFREDILLEPRIVYNVVEHLQELAINKIDLDTKGIAFERFLQDFFKGKMGQFFTPRPVVQFCVKMINPQLSDLILDPACGSGGFLLNTMDRIRIFAEENYDEKEAWEHWHKFAMNNIYGIEINDQIARVCKMNMIIHDDGHTNIISTDSLRDFNEITNIHKNFKKEYFDIILTNPPFGATVKSTEKDYLDKYVLGKDRKNQKTEILFIERCIEFTGPKNGKIAIVLPNGILTNSSLQYVRDFIMERCQILAIISLPQFTFSHYGAGIKSSLVFLRKKEEKEKLENYPIFMSIARHISYDATGRPDPINDLDSIYEEYQKYLINPKNYNEGKYECFTIYSNNIETRIDPYYYKSEFIQLMNKLKKIDFPLKPLGELSIKIINGLDYREFVEKGVPYLRVSNIKPNEIDLREVKNIPRFRISKDIKLKKGDLLVTRKGTYGIAVVVEDEYKDCVISSEIFRIELKKENINPYFISIWLNTKSSKLIFDRIKTGAIMGHISQEALKSIKIPLPPIEIQNEIVKKMKKEISEAEELKEKANMIIKESQEYIEKKILK